MRTNRVSSFIFRWILPAAMLFLVALTSVACGRSHSSGSDASVVGAGLAPPAPPESSGSPTHARTLDSILAEIDAYVPPKDVDAARFALLKAELKKLMIARAKGGKTVSVAASGALVSDLALSIDSTGTQGTLTWTEGLPGDYDNDGSVSIADIVPIARYYGQRTDQGPDDAHKLVDGDSDPEIGISDLTAIAWDYGACLEGYRVYRGHCVDGTTAWDSTWLTGPLPGDPIISPNPDLTVPRPVPPPISTRPTYRYVDNIGALPDKSNLRYKVAPFGDNEVGADSYAVGLPLPPEPGLATAGWPKAYGDQFNSGRSPYVGPQTSAVKWAHTVLERTVGWDESAIIAPDGTVYCGTCVFDPSTGAVVPEPGRLLWGPITIAANGTLYISADRLYAVNPLDWSVQWFSNGSTGIRTSSSAVGPEGTVYVMTVPFDYGSAGFPLDALNPADGSIRWSRMVTGFADPPAVDSDGTVYVVGDQLYAFNPTDGSTKWSVPLSVPTRYSPSIGPDGTVYVGGIDGTVWAFSPIDGSVRWSFDTHSNYYVTLAVGADETLFAISGGSLFCLDSLDGNVRWSYPTNTPGWTQISPVIGADGTVYVAGDQLYAFNPADGSIKWSYAPTPPYRFLASPAIGPDGALYIAKEDYTFYAFGP